MALTRSPWSGAAWAGARDVASSSGGGVLNDPTRPALTGWRWLALSGGLRPWAGAAWGGGGIVERPAQGGILAIAEPERAAIRVETWWSGSPYLRIVRLVEGYDPEPLRDGFPYVVRTATRRNRCADSSFEADTTQWLAGSNTTISQPADPAAAAGAKVGRLRATAAGSVSAIVPTSVSISEPEQVSLALRLSAAPSGALTVAVEWIDETGSSIGTVTSQLTAAQLAAFVAAAGSPMPRTPVLTLAPPPGASSGTMTLTIAGMAASATADLDAVLVEDESSAGERSGHYFDGDWLHGAWSIAPHTSPSSLAGVQRILDLEAPLDVPVRYQMTAPDAPGFAAVSEPVTLPSLRRVWLSHPGMDVPMQVTVNEEPSVTYPIEQEVMDILGGELPVAVTGARRSSSRGSYKIATKKFDDRDQLQDMLADGSPLLLRMPADHGHGPGEWVAFKDVTRSRTGHRAMDGTYRFELPFTVVRPPALPGAA